METKKYHIKREDIPEVTKAVKLPKPVIIAAAAVLAVILAFVFSGTLRTAVKRIFVSDVRYYISAEKGLTDEVSELYSIFYSHLSKNGRYAEISLSGDTSSIFDSLERNITVSAKTGISGNAFGADTDIRYNGKTVMNLQYIYDTDTGDVFLKIPDETENFLRFTGEERPVFISAGDYAMPEEFREKLSDWYREFTDGLTEETLAVAKSSGKINGEKYETFTVEFDPTVINSLCGCFDGADTVKMETYISSKGKVLGRRISWNNGTPQVFRITEAKDGGKACQRVEMSDKNGEVSVYLSDVTLKNNTLNGTFSTGTDGVTFNKFIYNRDIDTYGGEVILKRSGESDTYTLSSDGSKQIVNVISSTGRNFTMFSIPAEKFGFSLPQNYSDADGTLREFLKLRERVLDALDELDELLPLPDKPDEPEATTPEETTAATTALPPVTTASSAAATQQTTTAATTAATATTTTAASTTTAATTTQPPVTTTTPVTTTRDFIGSQNGFHAGFNGGYVSFPMSADELNLPVDWSEYDIQPGKANPIELSRGTIVYFYNPYAHKTSAKNALVVGLEISSDSSPLGGFEVNGFGLGDVYKMHGISEVGGDIISNGVLLKTYTNGNIEVVYGIIDDVVVSIKYLDRTEYISESPNPEGANLGSKAVKFNGNAVTFPLPARDYKINFTLVDLYVPANSTNTYFSIDSKAYIIVENNTRYDKKAEDCNIVQISADIGSSNTLSVGGVTLGSSESSIKSQFGEPAREYESLGTVYYSYIDEYSGVELDFKTENGKVTNIKYTYLK